MCVCALVIVYPNHKTQHSTREKLRAIYAVDTCARFGSFAASTHARKHARTHAQYKFDE